MLDAQRGTLAPKLGKGPRAGLCTDCGVSRMSDDRACGRACQFIAPDYPHAEARIHGRISDPARHEEAFFGVTEAMYRARLTPVAEGAQWTGITTALAETLLRAGAIEAVIPVAPDPDDVAPCACVGHRTRRLIRLPRDAHGLCPKRGLVRTRKGARDHALGLYQHPLSDLCPACA